MNARSVPAIAVLLAFLCSASGCAVTMALRGNTEAKVSGIGVGQDRAEVLATLGPAKKTYRSADKRVDVFKLKRGDEPSAGRAIAHGVLDVATLCVWEVVGTPIEAVQGESFYVTVQYDAEDRVTRVIPGEPHPVSHANFQKSVQQSTDVVVAENDESETASR